MASRESSGGVLNELTPLAMRWSNTADNITSLVASSQTNGFGVGSRIDLYKRVQTTSGSSSGGMWTLVERWEPSEAANSHTFSGLNGDSDRRYMIVSNVVANGATGQYFARLNNDAAGNYSARAFDGYGASTFENDRQTWTGICIGYTGDADQTADVAHIWAKSGRYRFCQIDSMRIASNLAQEIGRFGVVWANTADNITSLVLAAPGGGNFGVGSYVELWKLSNGSAGSSTAVSSDYTAILNGTTFYTLYTAPFYKPTTVTSLLNTDLCYDTSTKYYTCPVAGVYEITTWVSMGNNSARCVFALFKNDVNTAETYDIGAYYHNLSSSYCVSCEAGDTLLVVLSKDSGLAVPNDFQLKFKKIN